MNTVDLLNHYKQITTLTSKPSTLCYVPSGILMSESPGDETNSDSTIKPLVVSVYRDVWNEFYDWEQEHSKSMLKSLEAKGSVNPEKEAGMTSGNVVGLSSLIEEWDTKDKSQFHWNHELEIQAPSLSPCPEYESCLATGRPIHRGDDSDDLDFVPFPGDTTFNLEEYEDLYKSLAWQKSRRDPDCNNVLPINCAA